MVSSSNGVTQFFHKTDKTQKKGKYIDKNNKKLIEALAQKDYDNAFNKEAEKQEKQIQRALKCLPDKEMADVYGNLTDARKLFVKPHLLSDEEYIKQWLSVEYTGKPFYDEFLRYSTERGGKVRSKSEKIIADKLYKMGIPYRYEYPIQLKQHGTVYPDFTILIVSTRKEVYIEHFGMMDDPEYCEKALRKLQDYGRNGIILGKNLFATFESSNVPLDMNAVEKMLNALR